MEYYRNNVIRKIQLAPGELPVRQAGWLTADLWTGDVYFNANKNLPFKNSSVDYVFSEHFLEHLDFEIAVKHLNEIFRVLKPGGVTRISVPDLAAMCKTYVSKDKKVLNATLDLMKNIVLDSKKPIYKNRTKMFAAEYVNIGFIGFGHRYMWDFEVLSETLKALGFVDVKKFSEKKSDIKELKNLERHGEQDLLNSKLTFSAEAMKPAIPVDQTSEYSKEVDYILGH